MISNDLILPLYLLVAAGYLAAFGWTLSRSDFYERLNQDGKRDFGRMLDAIGYSNTMSLVLFGSAVMSMLWPGMLVYSVVRWLSRAKPGR